MFTYRVWPDYTINECSEPPYHWMSDDYILIDADSEEEALKIAEDIFN
jgi:hypothetical protein